MLRVLIALLLTGCGSGTPSPATPGPDGFVTVAAVRPPGGEPGFFVPIHRARLIGVDGSVAAAWEVLEVAMPVRVQPGLYRLEVFTVFLGDTVECVADPAAPGGKTCGQPTLGPAQVCSLDVDVVAGQQTRAAFHVLRDGLCGLESGDDPDAT